MRTPLLCFFALSSCSSGVAPPPRLASNIESDPPYTLATNTAAPTAPAASRDVRAQIVHAAREFIAGKKLEARGLHFDNNPVGFIQAAYWTVELDPFDPSIAAERRTDGMEILYRSAATRFHMHRGTPRAGDLVFWNSEPNSRALYPNQVAIVERVDGKGTISVLGIFANGPRRILMNLRSSATNGEAPSNDRINGYRADQLFRTFADPWG